MFGARPTYFVTRPDGTRTALVEVDQLPASIRITGVPANLPAGDALDMTCVGTRERVSFQYIIDIAAASLSTNHNNGIELSPLPDNGEDTETQIVLSMKKAHVSSNTKFRNSCGRDLFADRTSLKG